MINDAGQSLPWKERAATKQEVEQGNEGTDGSLSMSNGEISVMWASSQGGCDPLNRLLKNVQKSHLPPTNQTASIVSPFPPSSLGAISIVEEHTQASCSKASRPCFDSSGAPMLSNRISTYRPLKRTRSSLSRCSDQSQNGSSSPPLSWVGKAKHANPSSDALSRISRSLNQRMFSECTSSQQLRMQQKQPSERSSSQPYSSLTYVAPACLPKAGSLNRQAEVLQSAHPAAMAPSPTISTAQAERHTPTIANSPRKARIKALLETIDHAGSLRGQASSSGSSTAAGGHKPVGPSRSTIRKDRECKNQPHLPQLRKALALGMHRAIPLQAAHSSTLPQLHTASVVSKPRLISSSFAANLVGDVLQSATSSPNVVHHDFSHPPDFGQMDMHTRLPDNETQACQETTRRQWKTNGYRSSDPCSTTLSISGLPSVSEDNLEIVRDDECDLALIPRPTELCANTGHLSLIPRITSIPGEDVEVNLSSDGASSSSYGDIDIDPTALEDVCKAYDA